MKPVKNPITLYICPVKHKCDKSFGAGPAGECPHAKPHTLKEGECYCNGCHGFTGVECVRTR